MDITQRLNTAELLFRCAQGMGLEPVWISNSLFVVSVDGDELYINLARSPLNSQVSVSLSSNKHLTRLILSRNKLPNIPFARPKTQAQAEEFLHMHGKIIAKPVRGSGARDIHIITRLTQLRQLRIEDYILEQYIAGTEMRYLVLQGNVIGVHQSDYGTSVEATRPLKRISYHQTDWDPMLVDLSLRVVQTIGLNFAAVDYMIDAAGRAYILEVNSKPGLKWFHAPTSGPKVDVARLFLEASLTGSSQVPKANPQLATAKF